jgi:hypothetical protein
MSQHTHGKLAHESMPSMSQGETHEDTQQPTIVFLIPYPPLRNAFHRKKDSPPFLIYAPLQKLLVKPAKGEKESLPHKAMRKWETEEKNAQEKGTGFKAKSIKVHESHSSGLCS